MFCIPLGRKGEPNWIAHDYLKKLKEKGFITEEAYTQCVDLLIDAKGENKMNSNDAVNHPAHYTTGKIEVIDFITDKKLNFCRGNAVKYIVRAGLKDPDKEIEDLEKAIFYLNREIEDLKADDKSSCT